jgi:hypothetical protein
MMMDAKQGNDDRAKILRATSDEMAQHERDEYSRRHEARKELIEMENLNALSPREQFLVDAAVTRAKKEIFTALIESRVI